MTYSYNSRMNYSVEYKAKEKDQPLDTISSIVWDVYRSDPMFATSSWDGFVRIYAVNNGELNKVWEAYLHHPVLCIDMNEHAIIFAGLASGDVLAVDIQSNQVIVLGNHDAPICGLFWIREKGCLMTLGFDNLIKFWAVQSENAMQMQYQLPLKTVACSFDFPYLLVASIQTTIAFINLKNLPNITVPTSPDQYLRTSIGEKFSKFLSCRIICHTNTIIVGTIDGRALVCTFKEGYNGKVEILTPFVSRIQKRSDNKGSTLFGQVNALDLGIHNYETYSIIGGTEDIGVFNINKRTKSKTLCTASSSTGAGTAVRISPKSEYIAYATGSDWMKGLYELETIKKPRINVIKLTSTDLNDFISKT